MNIIKWRRTVDGEVAQCGTGRPLYLRIVAAEQKEDGVERIPPDRSHLLLRNLSKRQSCTPLEVDIVRERKCGQRGKW